MSVVFAYIKRTLPKLAVAPIDYAWDDWDYTDYLFEVRNDLLSKFSTLDALANRALTIGASEWIAVRLSNYSEHTELLNYLDAAWTTMQRPYHCDPIELDQSDWNGPIRGLMRSSMLIVDESTYAAEQDSGHALRTCWALTLAHHVIPNDFILGFEDWVETCFERLSRTNKWSGDKKYHDIFDPYFIAGNLVSPTSLVLDVDRKLDAELGELQKHTAQISDSNPFYSEG